MTGSFKVQLINMGTRAAAFQAKLRCLHEYHLRLLHNVLPAPSGVDIANTIKYFSQTLLTVLKDVKKPPYQLIRDSSQDHIRMALYPNLDFGNLYNALTMLLDVAPSIQYGQIIFGKALLQCLGCILTFLDKDLIDNLPYLVSSTISVLPSALHQDVINSLCYYILPFTITRQSSDEQECQACQSVSSVIMMVFQYSNNPAHHCQLMECLMTLKHNVVKDILCVVAYGTPAARSSAAKLLFYYWPAFDANLFDRRGLLCKLTNDLVPFVCQREQCPNTGNAEAAKVCYDHGTSITYAPDSPPPLYLCIECANDIHREHPDLLFGDILHPMQQVSMVCENKNCRSSEKSAFSICFSTECASYNGNHPIRYCSQCHSNRHNNRRGGDHIVHRSLPPAWQMEPEMQIYMVESVVSLLREAKPLNFEPGKDSSSCDPKNGNLTGLQDNISLEERQLLGRYGIWLLVGRCTPTPDTPVEILGRLLSMLFHWFHVTAYSYDSAGQVESTIEKLKTEHVCQWLKDICTNHYNVFISCLLPHPPEYGRVGGHWETLASRTSHLKEGLQRLICLVPYEVITSEIWDYVMPHWMEAITNDVAEKELIELKIVLSKILDPEMSPLGFDAKTMYNFVAIRFVKTTAKVQQQALHWLQILSKLEILIPLTQLFSMFGDGVRIMKHGVQHEIQKEKEGKDVKHAMKKEDNDIVHPPRRSSISPVVEDESGNTSAISDDEAPTSRHTEFSTDAEHNLTCCTLMLDILLKQMELQDVEQHMGIHTSVCENVCKLLKCMVTAARVGLSSHVCSLKVTECAYCEASIMWHQLSTQLVQFMAPRKPIRPPDQPIEEYIDDEKSSRKSPPESDKDKSRDKDVSLSMAPLPIPLGPLAGFSEDPGKIIIMAGPLPVAVPQPEPHSVGGVLVHMPHVCSTNDQGSSKNDLNRTNHVTDEIMTATVESVSEQLDLASIMPSEKIATAVARSITLSDADVASATVQVNKLQFPSSFAESIKTEQTIDEGLESIEEGEDLWNTSIGKFKFSIESLPQTLQYIYQLLTEIPTINKPDILYYMLQCLNVLTLHGDALTKSARDNRGFFIWCQENLIIKNLWDLCNAEHSHICQVGVPLLLHAITLPLGSDVFWRVVQESFNDSDWRVRFTAVERVTVITRFMDSTPLRSEVGLQTALATAFCHLIASMDDINVHVAQRSTLYLGTIHDNAIKALLFCLESQFDLFIVDRPVVLQSLYQLHNSLSDRKIFGWDFFLNRFDTLFVEAQINLEKNGDISYLRDLKNSENGSEVLSTKINKAREALSQSDTIGNMAKTLSASFGTKWPYKRTMSAPAGIIPRQDSKIEKEKIYSRQISAPILKRKTSKFGLGQFISGTNHNCSTILASASQTHGQPSAPYHSHYNPQFSLYPQLHLYHSEINSNAPTTISTPSQPVQQINLYPNIIQTQSLSLPQTSYFLQSKHNSYMETTAIGATDGHLHSIGGNGDESTFTGVIHRIIDLEESDKETIHLLVFLLMQFMSRVDQAFPSDEKPIAKTQNIVLKHLFLLLGYNQLDKTFHIPPVKQRSSAVFNAFIANLPQVLDQNHLIGWVILPSALQVILYAPNPSNSIQNGVETIQNLTYNYTLWYLEAHVRRNWLMSILVVLYKYQYTQAPYSYLVNSAIRIILNSLRAQFHQCKRLPTTTILDIQPLIRNRDTSQQSIGTDTDEKLLESPPNSPMFFTEGTSQNINNQNKTKITNNSYTQRISQTIFRKPHETSLDNDETESELVAIPESDFSDSTVHGSSAPGSFEDPLHFDDIMAPLKPEIIKNKSHVTTANLATAHVALSTLKAAETLDEKKDFSKLEQQDSQFKQSNNKNLISSKLDTTKQLVTQNKCSLQEGVRMMVTPSMIVTSNAHEKAILNPPVNVQTAVTVIQNIATSTAQIQELVSLSCATSKINYKNNINKDEINIQPTKILGRQKRIIDLSISPVTTSSTTSTSTSTNSLTKCIKTKNFERTAEGYGSPESPLSKMSVLQTPDEIDSIDDLPSPKSISHLEIPAQERLLPIGASESIAILAEKIREALSIPDISHLKQESLDKSEDSTNADTFITPNSRITSPRRLIKQTALESPPHLIAKDDIGYSNQRQRLRRVGPFAIDPQSAADIRTRYAGAWPPSSNHPDESLVDEDFPNEITINLDSKPSSSRVGDDCVSSRCFDCGAMLEEYNDEEIGIMIIILGTFIHREPTLAAPFLPEILSVVSKFAMHFTFPWQNESSTHLPGGSQSVAHQFIRCVLHQLAPNGVFTQLFQTEAKASVRQKYFKSIAQALIDFNELNPTSPIQMLTETLNSKKTLPLDNLSIVLRNISEYLQCVPMDSSFGTAAWLSAVQGIETLFRRLILVLPNLEDAEYLLDIMVCVLKIPGVSKVVLDPFSKVLSFCIQNKPLKHKILYDLCTLSVKAFSKERDKLVLCRQIVFEFIQALKFKTNIPDTNLLLIAGFTLQDAGGLIPPGTIEGLPEHPPLFTTNSGDCMRQYINDIIDFLADFHTLSKIKSFKSTLGLGEDTLGGILKGTVAQYVALEVSRCNSRDNKAISRFLPWLYNAPSSLQQGPKEFTECVGHIRLLSWILLGSLTYTASSQRRGGSFGYHGSSVHCHLQHTGHVISQPVPQEASCPIADHIQVIFTGFAEQSKTSVMHMSSLFHAFILCQLWTVYLEQVSHTVPASSDASNITIGILFEFWTKVTPCILQMISHSKALSEIVNLHFLSLLEALKETQSTLLLKLLPLWNPVLSSNAQLSGTLQVRLQNCRDCAPSLEEQQSHHSQSLLKWLQRLQFKMGQIELQSSTATQFYSI